MACKDYWRIKNLLKKLEWCAIADFQLYSVPKCPICGGLKSDTKINNSQIVKGGHKANCELAKEIEGYHNDNTMSPTKT